MRLPRKSKLKGYGIKEDQPKELRDAQSVNETKLVKLIADKIEATGAIRAAVKQKKRKIEYLDTSKLLE